MPRATYRGRAAQAEVGDFVAGWADAEMTAEVAGYVVSFHPEHERGDNVTLAVVEYDPYPEGVEPTLQGEDKKGVVVKDHAGKAAVLNLRLVTANSERLELVRRRVGLEGHAGLMRLPHPDVMHARHASEESRRRQAQAGTPGVTTPPPIVSGPPEPLTPAAGDNEDEPTGKKDEPTTGVTKSPRSSPRK